jgi:PBP1b-binding outer membrane lipoprotein LpoB
MKKLNWRQVILVLGLAAFFSGCAAPQPSAPPPTVVKDTKEDTTKVISSDPVVGKPADK